MLYCLRKIGSLLPSGKRRMLFRVAMCQHIKTGLGSSRCDDYHGPQCAHYGIKPCHTLLTSCHNAKLYCHNARTCAKKSSVMDLCTPTVAQAHTRKFHSVISTSPTEMVSIDKLCSIWSQLLKEQAIPEPVSSVEYFIAFVLGMKTLHGVDRKTQLTSEQMHKVNEMCKLRLQHWPVQYILGEWDFGDLVLKMRPPVFIPRPETEELVSIAARCVEERNLQSGRLLELCCGSGAISVSMLHKFPQMTGVAVDISHDACSLTMENAQTVGVDGRLTLFQEDLASPKALTLLEEHGPFDVLISNPPYIPRGDLPSLERQILEYEDVKALDGGYDGLDIVRKILNMCPAVMQPHGDIWLEVNPGHPADIRNIVADSPQLGLEFVASCLDYLGRERFCHLHTTLYTALKCHGRKCPDAKSVL